MHSWIMGEKHNLKHSETRLGRNSSRIMDAKTYDRVRLLTIKVRYNPAFDLMHTGAPIHVEEVLTQAFNVSGGVRVKVAKLKYTDQLTNQHRLFNNS
jgi:hypothetical protein